MAELISRNQDTLICLIGDFNCVRNAEERKGCQYRSLDSHHFNVFIRDSELHDVKFNNSLFTLCGSNNRLSRLDRALIKWRW